MRDLAKNKSYDSFPSADFSINAVYARDFCRMGFMFQCSFHLHCSSVLFLSQSFHSL